MGGAAKPKQLGQDRGDGANDARYKYGWGKLWSIWACSRDLTNNERPHNNDCVANLEARKLHMLIGLSDLTVMQ